MPTTKKRYTEEQIISALRQYEGGEKTADICRKLGVSQANLLYVEEAVCGLGIQELRELRNLREENGRLKRIVADLTLDRQILQEIVSKKAVKPSQKRRLARWAQEAYRISMRRAARVVGLFVEHPAVHQSKAAAGSASRASARAGGNACALWLSAPGGTAAPGGLDGERHRIYRLYDQENLKVRSVERKKISRRQRVAHGPATAPNQCWSADFVSDKLTDGRCYRILTVIDQFTRECVAMEADRSLHGRHVVAALTRAIVERGRAPRSITLDNGSEFTGRALEAWAIQHGVGCAVSAPGGR